MSESVQSRIPTDKLEKRAYGVLCTNCGNHVLVGYVLLGADAQLEDLQNEVESLGGLGGFVDCRFPFENGQQCNESNSVLRGSLVFVEARTLDLYDKMVDDPSQG